MKHIVFTITVLLLSLSCAYAQSGKSIYQKYSDSEGVSAVYISPAMFRMIRRLPELKAGGEDFDLAPIVQSLSGLYIISTEDTALGSKLKGDVDKFISSGDYELLMEAKDSGETVRMYSTGSPTIVTGFVMLSQDGGETTFISLDGKISRDELERLIASQVH